jgi:hypothetical protein
VDCETGINSSTIDLFALKHTAMTLMFFGKSSPVDCKCPRRNPWEYPRILFGFMWEKTFS